MYSFLPVNDPTCSPRILPDVQIWMPMSLKSRSASGVSHSATTRILFDGLREVTEVCALGDEHVKPLSKLRQLATVVPIIGIPDLDPFV